jgi:hypothetical protein
MNYSVGQRVRRNERGQGGRPFSGALGTIVAREDFPWIRCTILWDGDTIAEEGWNADFLDIARDPNEEV